MVGSARRVVIEFIGDDDKLVRAIDSSERASGRLSGKLGKLGKAAAIGLGAGVVVAGKALFDMTKNAVADEAAQRKLAIALKNSVGATDTQVASVEKWIAAQGRALGVTDDELRPAFQRLVQATGSVDEAQRQMGIAMDVSAGTGKSLKVVSEALMKANNGSTASLSKLGLKTKDAEGNTLSLDQALQSMSKTFKGQAAAQANTLEGKMGRLKLIFDETKETIGAKLIPVVTKLADWFLSKGLPAIQEFGGWLQDNLGPIFARIGDTVAKLTGGMQGDFGSSLQSIRDIVSGFVDIVRTLWERFGADFVRIAKGQFRTVVAVIRGALQVIRGVVKVVSGLLKGDWSKVWSGIKDIVAGVARIIVAVVKQLMLVLRTVFRAGWGVIKDVARAAWDGLVGLVKAGAGKVVDYVRSIPDKMRNLAGLFAGAGRAVIGAFVDGLKNAAGVVSGIAGNVWSAVRSLLNGAIDRINAALEFRISLPGPDVTVNPPNIPHLAKGTRWHRGGWAIVGEQGPELAFLPRGSSVTPHQRSVGMLRQLGQGAGGGIHFHGPVYGDPRAFARAVIEALLAEKRLTGQSLVGLLS